MKRTKNTTAKKPRQPRAQWPKGSGKRGFVSNADLPFLKIYLEEVAAREKAEKRREARERKNANLRAARQLIREQRQALMMKPDAITTLAELRDNISGWGSTSTSRLREGLTYAWHGVFRVRGGKDALGEVLKKAGSLRKLPKQSVGGDPNYYVTVTPWLGNHTPEEATAQATDEYGTPRTHPDGRPLTVLESKAEEAWKQISAPGAHADYLGAFYNPHSPE